MTKNVEKQKGITLVALIITIIVMLILVGVTLNIALGENGLIEKAKYARQKQEEQTILEQIIALATWDKNGSIEVENTYARAEEKFSVIENTWNSTKTEVKFTIKGKFGAYEYKISGNEISIGGEIKKSKLKFFGNKDENAGILIKENNEVEIGIYGENLFLPIINGYLKEKAEIKIGDETRTYNNAIFSKSTYVGAETINYYYISAYLENDKLVLMQSEYNSGPSNMEDSTKEIIEYTSITEEKVLEQSQYPGENLLDGDMYSGTPFGGFNYIIINENKNRYAMGATDDSIFYPLGENECVIKENYVAVLNDGSTIDYSGKKAVFIPEQKSGEYFEFFGYIENNKFVFLNAEIFEKEEIDGKTMPKTYNSIEEGEIYNLKKKNK